VARRRKRGRWWRGRGWGAPPLPPWTKAVTSLIRWNELPHFSPAPNRREFFSSLHKIVGTGTASEKICEILTSFTNDQSAYSRNKNINIFTRMYFWQMLTFDMTRTDI
jgi:hypothetical protein